MPSGSSGKTQTTIIDIPIPKVDTTELEVVHVFPQGMGPGMQGGGGFGYNNYPQGIPSFSVVTQENGTSQTSNVWGFNPGGMQNSQNKVALPGKSIKGMRKLRIDPEGLVQESESEFRKKQENERLAMNQKSLDSETLNFNSFQKTQKKLDSKVEGSKKVNSVKVMDIDLHNRDLISSDTDTQGQKIIRVRQII